MGKTKEMLIGMQEEIAMNFPTPSSNTLSEPVQTLDIEALTDDLYNLLLDRSSYWPLPNKKESLRDLLGDVLPEVLADHGIT